MGSERASEREEMAPGQKISLSGCMKHGKGKTSLMWWWFFWYLLWLRGRRWPGGFCSRSLVRVTGCGAPWEGYGWLVGGACRFFTELQM